MITTSELAYEPGVFRFKMWFVGLKSPKPTTSMIILHHLCHILFCLAGCMSLQLHAQVILSMSISALSPEMKNLCKVPDHWLSDNQTTNSNNCIMYQNVSMILLKNLNSLLTLLIATWWYSKILQLWKKKSHTIQILLNPNYYHSIFCQIIFFVRLKWFDSIRGTQTNGNIFWFIFNKTK